MATHHLKTWPEFFEGAADGRKPFEVRRDDRGYAVGDTLILQEWEPAWDEPYNEHPARYTGREVTRTVVYVLRGGQFGIEDGYVVMGIQDPDTVTVKRERYEALERLCDAYKQRAT